MSEDLIDDLSKLSLHGRQIWLLGAGASVESNLPLVSELTDRVRIKLAGVPFEGDTHPSATIGHVIEGLRADIGDTANIEDVLDHLSDHLSIAHRSANESAMVNILSPEGDPDLKSLATKSLDLSAHAFWRPYATRCAGATCTLTAQKPSRKAHLKNRSFVSITMNPSSTFSSPYCVPVESVVFSQLNCLRQTTTR